MDLQYVGIQTQVVVHNTKIPGEMPEMLGLDERRAVGLLCQLWSSPHSEDRGASANVTKGYMKNTLPKLNMVHLKMAP